MTSNSQENTPVKDGLIQCAIDSLAFGGRGVARVDGMAVFVTGGLPGDECMARVTRVKKRFAEARLETLITPSDLRVKPRCAHFGECGGCVLQSLEYKEQLAQKGAQVENALARIGGASITMEAPVGSPEIWGYRNKMEFAFEQQGRSLMLGLRARSEGGRQLPAVLDLTECHLCSDETMVILSQVRRLCRDSGIRAYDPSTGNGFWRHLVVRETGLGERMVHLITTHDKRKFQVVAAIFEELAELVPGLASMVHSTRKARSVIATGETIVQVAGASSVEETLGSVRYHVSPNAFFQTNTAGAEQLFGAVAEFAGLTGGERILDLYCGTGAIGLYLAEKAGQVFGLEINAEAVEQAKISARLNDFTNCTFVAGSLDSSPAELANIPTPDVVVVDPPRSGMHPATADWLLESGVQKIVAVSCNPNTLARDVKHLSSAYTLKRARAVDMFPHTHHIETVALLERN